MIRNISHQQMVVDALCKSLADVKPEVRAKAADSLGKIGNEMAVAALLDSSFRCTPLRMTIYTLYDFSNIL